MFQTKRLFQIVKLKINFRYQLSEDEIWAGLPLLDTEETDISDWCPDRLSLRRSCPPNLARYRSVDGTCNNEGSLAWAQGASQQPFPRMLPPVYSDGMQIYASI